MRISQTEWERTNHRMPATNCNLLHSIDGVNTHDENESNCSEQLAVRFELIFILSLAHSHSHQCVRPCHHRCFCSFILFIFSYFSFVRSLYCPSQFIFSQANSLKLYYKLIHNKNETPKKVKRLNRIKKERHEWLELKRQSSYSYPCTLRSFDIVRPNRNSSLTRRRCTMRNSISKCCARTGEYEHSWKMWTKKLKWKKLSSCKCVFLYISFVRLAVVVVATATSFVLVPCVCECILSARTIIFVADNYYSFRQTQWTNERQQNERKRREHDVRQPKKSR